MRVIFLNSWFGNGGAPFLNFIEKESLAIDIFCLMEITPELHLKLSKILKNFNGLYQKGLVVKNEGLLCGQSIFLSKQIKVGKNGKVSIYRQSHNDVGFLQFSKVAIGQRSLWLGSVHGRTRPGGKLDTPIRLKQSEKIINFFADKNGPKIIGGDFNLLPQTQSIAMFGKAGYTNLIDRFGIKETRGKINHRIHEKQGNIQHFADYVFVSSDVKVKNFEVPDVEISDHLPLILDFEI